MSLAINSPVSFLPIPNRHKDQLFSVAALTLNRLPLSKPSKLRAMMSAEQTIKRGRPADMSKAMQSVGDQLLYTRNPKMKDMLIGEEIALAVMSSRP